MSSSPARYPDEVSSPMWYVGAGVCALADSERHLGHAIHDADSWTAYDAVHPNKSRDGFLVLGRFKSMGDAIRAIESSVGVFESQLTVVAQPRAFIM